MTMKRFGALALSLLLSLQPVLAADVSINNLPAASSVTGTDVFPATQGGTTTRKATAAQISTYTRSVTTKSDVGLGNVDNTSDATKNAASVTLTNKTLTAPVINSPTGIAKGDVGLGNVDNTSNATERAAAATLTNKSISGSANTLTNIPLSTAVTGRLPFANHPQLAGLSVLGVTGASTADMAGITASAAGQVVRYNGTGVAFSLPQLTAISYAGLPTCNAGATGLQYIVTDVGVMTCDGSVWLQLTSITSTWAGRGTGLFTGQTKRASDVGVSPGTLLRWDGTYWTVTARTIVGGTSVLVSASANTTENVIKTIDIPAGLLRSARFFVVRVVWAKSGVTNNATQARVRLGSSVGGSNTDPLVMGTSNLSGTNRSLAAECWFIIASSTSVAQNSNAGSIAGWSGVATTGTANTAVTIPDLDANALVLSFLVQMAGTTDLGQVAQTMLELVP